MAIVAGVDFGTLSVRVSIVDSERGRLGSGAAEYPLHRRKEDPDHATQSHADHMSALVAATRRALAAASVSGEAIEAHRARYHRVERDAGGREPEAARRLLSLVRPSRVARSGARSRTAAHRTRSGSDRWCGGTYSSEWGFSKLLHWLRNNPAKRDRMATALEHCDMVAAVLCGVTERGRCARAASAPWATSGCGTRRSAACLRRSS